VFRLSPFDPDARLMIEQIYEDLSKHASFSGILFSDDAVLDDYEDAGRHALHTYSLWGLPADVGKIRESPDLMKRWTRQKSRYLIDLTRQLEQIVLAYQNVGDVLTARNLFALPVIKPESEAWYAQNYDDFLATYDYVALMAMPYMEQASDPERWLDQLVRTVRAKQRGLQRTVFELQPYDWHARKEVSAGTLLAQMRRLRSEGAVNFGYYPDNFLNGQPELDAMRDVMSLKSRLDPTSINALMQMQNAQGPGRHDHSLIQRVQDFVFYYPLFMSYLWMIGGVVHYFLLEEGRTLGTRAIAASGIPKVSIVVPCFNEAANARSVIRHLDAMDYPNYDVIAVNDGSRTAPARSSTNWPSRFRACS
jgi:hypothetical protein